jgi:hypothetical protein
MEFLQNIWSWIVTNKQGLETFFSSTTFAAIVTAIVAIVKQIKTSKQNTKSLDGVKETLAETNIIKTDVELVKEATSKSEQVIQSCNTKIEDVENKLNEFISSMDEKVNAMLEVQSIVYSTIKDDTIRTSVNSILVQAKHSGAKAKADLAKELEEIKAKFHAMVQSTNEQVDEMVDEVKHVVVPNEENSEHTRY